MYSEYQNKGSIIEESANAKIQSVRDHIVIINRRTDLSASRLLDILSVTFVFPGSESINRGHFEISLVAFEFKNCSIHKICRYTMPIVIVIFFPS